jgi:hypothetical protein
MISLLISNDKRYGDVLPFALMSKIEGLSETLVFNTALTKRERERKQISPTSWFLIQL